MVQSEYLVGGIVLVLLILWVWQDEAKNPESLERVAEQPNDPLPLPSDPELIHRLVWFWQVSNGERVLRHDWKANVPWARLAREIVWFTESALKENKISHYPSIVLRYYKHKRWAGVYYGGTQEIVIYLKNHSTIQEFVDTVLHEVCHHIQNKGKSREYKKYNEYNSKYGYYNNPLEVESRKFAKEWTVACLEHLKDKQLIY